jgi:predicted alpha/beta hydrolase
LARGLYERGWGVLTIDYAGVGQSPGDERISADDWVEDVRAAIEFARAHSGARFLAVLGHSLGGQLIGQCLALPEVDGLLLVAAQRGMPQFFRGRSGIRVLYAYGVILAATWLLGRLPPHRLTLPVSVPAAALRQWARWGLSGVYRNRDGISVETRFRAYEGPITSITIADDRDNAPPAAVEALLGLFSSAEIRRIELRPADVGLERIGHFGLFRNATPRVCTMVDDWLRDLEQRASPGVGN